MIRYFNFDMGNKFGYFFVIINGKEICYMW